MLVEIPRPRTQEGYLARLEKYRGRFESIASAKYDAGKFQRYANSYVVPITVADW